MEKRAWKYVLGALGTAGLMEVAQMPNEGYWSQSAGERGARMLTNLVFGAGGATKGFGGWAAATSGAPFKDIGISMIANDTAGKFADANVAAAERDLAEKNKSNLTAWLLGGLGLGALGLGGLALYKYWNQKDPVAAKNGARLRYRLAGDDALPGREAEVDIPISSPDITDKMLENLDSGMRRQLRKTIKLNSRKKDPVTGKLISYDAWTDKYGEHGEFLPDKYKTEETMMDLEKAASFLRATLIKSAGQAPPPPPAPEAPPAGDGSQSVPGGQATQQVAPHAQGISHAPKSSGRTASTDRIRSNVQGVHSALARMSNAEAVKQTSKAKAAVARQQWDDLKGRIAAMGAQQ